MESRELPQPGREPNSWLAGEPVTRPDGLIVSIRKDGLGCIIRTEGNVAGKGFKDDCFYSSSELEALGNGDVDRGIIKAAQAAYGQDVTNRDRQGTPLDDELDQIDPRNGL